MPERSARFCLATIPVRFRYLDHLARDNEQNYQALEEDAVLEVEEDALGMEGDALDMVEAEAEAETNAVGVLMCPRQAQGATI